MKKHIPFKLGEGADAREYAILRMPPGQALYFIPKVTKALAPLLLGDGDLMALAKNDGDLNTAIKLIIGGLKEIDPEIITELFREAIEYECYGGGQRLSDRDYFDEWFDKHPGDMLQVCAWAIWQNSKDFFPGGRELMDYLASRVKANVVSLSPKDGSPSTPSEE